MQQKYACLPTTPVYCADTVPCKNYYPLTSVYSVIKSGPFTVCNEFARCHPNLIVFSRHMSEEFCNENLTWLYMLQLYLATTKNYCKQQFVSVPITKCMLPKLHSEISAKEKLAAQSKCLKCCPSALTQAHSRPWHSLMALSTTRCSRPDHAMACSNQALHCLLPSNI